MEASEELSRQIDVCRARAWMREAFARYALGERMPADQLPYGRGYLPSPGSIEHRLCLLIAENDPSFGAKLQKLGITRRDAHFAITETTSGRIGLRVVCYRQVERVRRWKNRENIRTRARELHLGYAIIIRPDKSVDQRLLTSAMRGSVWDHSSAAMGGAWSTYNDKYTCAFTGERLSRGAIHIHHHGRSFEELCESFYESVGGRDVIRIASSRKISEPHYTQWRAYHLEHAVLAIVSRKAHLAYHGRLRRKDLSQPEKSEICSVAPL